MWDTRLVRNRIINDRNRILGVPTLTYFIDSTCYSLTSPSTRVVGYRKGFDSGQEASGLLKSHDEAVGL
jgi:hypothetical protein